MAEGPTPFFIAACSVGIKKPGHHTRLHAQMSLSIGSQSTSKRAAIPMPQTLPPACALINNSCNFVFTVITVAVVAPAAASAI